MNSIIITPHSKNNYTLVPNWFIDHYLANSNGDFIKVYLLLLRYVSNDIHEFSTSNFADQLYLTDSDVVRALKFWATQNLLALEEDQNKITSISFIESVEPVLEEQAVTIAPERPETIHMNISPKPQYNMEELSSFMAAAKYKDLIYVTGRYLGKNLTQSDLGTLISLHDWLGLPMDVIEWLIEYCVSNNHRNMRYIETVAIEWADKGINNLEKAKIHTEIFNKKYFEIKKALGLSSRNPVLFEIQMMDKWIDEYKFDLEIIIEACTRTIIQAPNASFKYTDSILTHWHKNNVHTLKDIETLDQQHISKNVGLKIPGKPTQSKNKFINFEQRDYDFEKIEKKAMEMILKDNLEGGYNS